MDPGLALTALGPPAVLVHEVLLLPGACGPLALPLAGLAPRSRAGLLAATPDVSLPLLLRTLLDGGDEDEAWRVVASHPRDGDLLSATLLTWSAQEQARLGLPVARGALIGLGAPPGSEGAIATAVSLLGHAPGRWHGPLVVAGADAGFPALAEPGLLIRPALPALRLAAGATRSAVAAGSARLVLGLSRPPLAGWPRWLNDGCAGLAALLDREGLASPQAMQQRRQAAGPTTLGLLLEDRAAEPGLATAIAAYLLHERRRDRLASLLDLLRSGASSAGALRIAYGLTADDLATLR